MLSLPGLSVLVGIFLILGFVFGSLELLIVAFCDEAGQRSMAGVVIASHAVGSLAAGLWYGVCRWRASLPRRFLLGLAGFATSILPFVFAPNVAVMAGLALPAGLAIAPALIPGFGLVERLVPSRMRTEGFTWVATAVGIGIAAGSGLAGRAVESVGAHPAFLLPLVAALLGLGLGGSAVRALRTAG